LPESKKLISCHDLRGGEGGEGERIASGDGMKRRRKRREIGRKELVERTGKQEVQEGIGKVGVCASFAVQSSTGKCFVQAL
jgi:hypothetical protein